MNWFYICAQGNGQGMLDLTAVIVALIGIAGAFAVAIWSARRNRKSQEDRWKREDEKRIDAAHLQLLAFIEDSINALARLTDCFKGIALHQRWQPIENPAKWNLERSIRVAIAGVPGVGELRNIDELSLCIEGLDELVRRFGKRFAQLSSGASKDRKLANAYHNLYTEFQPGEETASSYTRAIAIILKLLSVYQGKKDKHGDTLERLDRRFQRMKSEHVNAFGPASENWEGVSKTTK